MATVTIKGTGPTGIQFDGNVRRVGDPVPAQRFGGPDWTFILEAGDYYFNANYWQVIAGNTVSFSFVGATPQSPTSFTAPGDSGQMSSDNIDILFAVP